MIDCYAATSLALLEVKKGLFQGSRLSVLATLVPYAVPDECGVRYVGLYRFRYFLTFKAVAGLQ